LSDVPPAGVDVHLVKAWAQRQFDSLAAFLGRPEFRGVVLSRVDAEVPDEVKIEDGLMQYFDGGVVGPQPGVYFYEGGSWKQL
jgi:hypothetical protein